MSNITPDWAPSLSKAKPGQLVHWVSGTGLVTEVVPVVKVGRTFISVDFGGSLGEQKFRIENGCDAAHTLRSPGVPSRIFTEEVRLANQQRLADLLTIHTFGIRIQMQRSGQPKLNEDDIHAIAELIRQRHPEVKA